MSVIEVLTLLMLIVNIVGLVFVFADFCLTFAVKKEITAPTSNRSVISLTLIFRR